MTNQAIYMRSWMFQAGAAVVAALLLFSACVKDEFDAPENNGCIDEGLVANITIADLKAFYSGTTIQVQQDLIIEGVVISDDKEGNFFKELVIQDATGGILLLLDQSELHTRFPMGRKVYIKCQGLYMSDYAGLIQMGGSLDPDNGDLLRIPQSLVNNYIYRGPCNQAVDTLTIPVNQLNPSLHQSRLVKLEGLKMGPQDAGVSYANPSGTSTVNRDMTDCNNSPIILRTSDFSSFAGETTPTQRFTLTGVFSVFNNDFQVKMRVLEDVELTGSGCPCVEIAGSVKGTTTFQLDDVKVEDDQQNTLLNEDFGTVSDGSAISLSGWKNIAQNGSVTWLGDAFQSNLFARASAYQSGNADATFWLITPQVNLTSAAETLTFRTLDAFDDGAVLEVLISTDYDGGNNPENFTWDKVCPELAGGTTSGFATNWTESGAVSLDGYSGSIYIAFRYKGGE